MVFYRMRGNEMEFRLLDEEAREDYSVWDTVQKRFIRELPDSKFMKADVFKQSYPNMRKASQYIRHIAVYENGILNKYDFGFKKTANDQINTFIANMRAIKHNPLDVKLVMRITGQGLGKEYKIVAMDMVGRVDVQEADARYNVVPLNVQSKAQITPSQPSSEPKGNLVLMRPQAPKFELDKVEQEMVSMFEKYPEKCSDDRYVEVWVWNEPKMFNTRTTESRIKEIYNNTYKK